MLQKVSVFMHNHPLFIKVDLKRYQNKFIKIKYPENTLIFHEGEECNSLGIIIGSFIVGFLIEYFKIDKAILIMMIVAVLGIVITIFYDRKTKDRTV